MRIEAYLFAFVAVFLALCDVVYWFMSYDPTGTTAIALACGMSIIIGSYALVTGRRTGMRPEDLVDGEIADAAGEVGFFSPHSWWPLPTAFSAALVAVGWIFGWWLFLIGMVFLIGSVAGLILEYYANPNYDF
ncbi:MAG TPA: cytochrome c oxidase subunit 4 [Mycobacteriales bacterium]|nr:cytochrome c oxidase subunit 4 [Mycobacteriales bacterium]